MRPVSPALVRTEHAFRRDVGNEHRRMDAVVWRSALGVVEAEHTDKPHSALLDRQDLQIIDDVTCAYRAAAPALDVERVNLLLPFEPIVADREQSLLEIKLMRMLPPLKSTSYQ